MKSHAPQDTDLHDIVIGLQQLQAKHLYGLTASVKHAGHYHHAHSTDITVFDFHGGYAADSVEDELAELLRDYMNWIYKRLEAEFEWLNSDEQVDETIKANEYEFTEDGHRW